MSVSDLDIWRTANELVKQHGPGAWIFAAKHHSDLKEAGDTEGAAVFYRVATAIAELVELEDPESNTAH